MSISGGNSIVRGLVINNFSIGNGIEIITNGGNTIEGNFVGTNNNATIIKDNYYGVRIFSDSNLVGGNTSAARNIISGNAVSGVALEGSMNLIQGNFIRTGVDRF